VNWLSYVRTLDDLEWDDGSVVRADPLFSFYDTVERGMRYTVRSWKGDYYMNRFQGATGSGILTILRRTGWFSKTAVVKIYVHEGLDGKPYVNIHCLPRYRKRTKTLIRNLCLNPSFRMFSTVTVESVID